MDEPKHTQSNLSPGSRFTFLSPISFNRERPKPETILAIQDAINSNDVGLSCVDPLSESLGGHMLLRNGDVILDDRPTDALFGLNFATMFQNGTFLGCGRIIFHRTDSYEQGNIVYAAQLLFGHDS
jgi:hypothetical protein